MRVKIVSDLHGADEHLREAARDCDQLLVLGDLINVLDYRNRAGILVEVYGEEPVFAAADLRAAGRFEEARGVLHGRSADPEDRRGRFLDLAAAEYDRVFDAMPPGTIVTHGNVDVPSILLERLPSHVRFVDGDVVEIGGERFGFVGGGVRTPLRIPGEVEEDEYDAKLRGLGRVDVVCTHMPPRIPWFVYDVVARKFEPGSAGLIDYCLRNEPRRAYFGHVHQPLAARGTIGRTELVNDGHFAATGRAWIHETPT